MKFTPRRSQILTAMNFVPANEQKSMRWTRPSCHFGELIAYISLRGKLKKYKSTIRWLSWLWIFQNFYWFFLFIKTNYNN